MQRRNDLTKNARQLRKNQTIFEKKLWAHLRDRGFEQYKFYRQHVIGEFIVDFCCPNKRVVIELDGGGHAKPDQEKYDQRRDHELEAFGYKVVRVWNHDFYNNQIGFMENLKEVLDKR